jgi:hypothetical protein
MSNGNPEPFSAEQEQRLSSVVEGTIAAKLANVKRVTGIVAAIVTPILAFLGWLGAGQLREAWNKDQDRIISDTVAERSKAIEAKINDDLKVFVEKNNQVQQLYSAQFEDDKRRLEDTMFAAIKEASDKNAQSHVQLEQFLEQQKAAIAEKKEQIEAEIDNAVTTRASLEQAKSSAIQAETDLRLQLDKAAATSRTVAALISQMGVECDDLQKEKGELDNQIASVRPKIDAIRSILADQNAAEIFNKLQQEFTRIRSLEVRVTYIFPSDVDDVSAVYNGLWIEKNSQHFLQFYPERDKTTSIASANAKELVCRYVLFAPFEMEIEGRPIRNLKNVNNFKIYFDSNPEMYREDGIEKTRALYTMVVNELKGSLKKLTGIRVQLLLNGYSSFDKTFRVTDLTIATVQDAGIEKEWTFAIDLPVNELFTDPEGDYSRQFSPTVADTALGKVSP